MSIHISYLRRSVVDDIRLSEEDVPLIENDVLTEAGVHYLQTLRLKTMRETETLSEMCARLGVNLHHKRAELGAPAGYVSIQYGQLRYASEGWIKATDHAMIERVVNRVSYFHAPWVNLYDR